MGCMGVLGPCEIFTQCDGSCKIQFGQKAIGDCDRSGGLGTCVCYYSCPPAHKTHM